MSKDLDDLFHETLKYTYYAEKEIHSALPTIAKAARSDALRDALENIRRRHRITSRAWRRSSTLSTRQRKPRPVKVSRVLSLSAWK
jgi:hypothetical protein